MLTLLEKTAGAWGPGAALRGMAMMVLLVVGICVAMGR